MLSKELVNTYIHKQVSMNGLVKERQYMNEYLRIRRGIRA